MCVFITNCPDRFQIWLTYYSVEVKFVGGMRMTPAWYPRPSAHLPPWWGLTPNSPVMWPSWSMGNFSPRGEGLCNLILNLAVLAPHKISLPFSHVPSSCSHAAKSYQPRSRHKTWLRWGTDGSACLPRKWTPIVILFFKQAAPWCAWGD